MPIAMIDTLLLIFAFAAFLMGAIISAPPTRVTYIALGLALATLAFLLKG